MVYVSEKHYRNYHGGKYSGDDLGEQLKRASALVDALTHNRIVAVGFENLTGFQQKAVRKACCLIVDGPADATAPNADIESFMMQDMRINMRKRNVRPWEAAGIGVWAWMTLMQTGLMRGNVG